MVFSIVRFFLVVTISLLERGVPVLLNFGNEDFSVVRFFLVLTISLIERRLQTRNIQEANVPEIAEIAELIIINYILFVVWYVLGLYLKILVRRTITIETRENLANHGKRIFEVIFAYYRLSLAFLSSHKPSSAVSRLTKYYYKYSNREICNRWSEQLPEDLIQLTQQRLNTLDDIRFRSVCRSWRSSATNGNSYDKAALPQLPWLMLGSHPLSIQDHCFFSLVENRMYKSCPPLMSRRNCVGSIEGWLIMADNVFWRPEGFMNPWSLYQLIYRSTSTNFPTVNFFLNPISGARLSLPSQSTIQFPHSNQFSFLRKVIASSSPHNSNCLVAAIFSGGGLAVCRPNDDSWTHINVNVKFLDIEFIDGKLYAALKHIHTRTIALLEIHDNIALGGNRYTFERIVSETYLPVPSPLRYDLFYTESEVYTEISSGGNVHLAKDCASNELFVIFREICDFAWDDNPPIPWSDIIGDKNFFIPPKTKGFRVFKLDANDGNIPRLLEVADLGDRTVFVSEAANKFIVVSSNDPQYKINLEKNCIYFAFDNPYLSSIAFDSFTSISFGSGSQPRELDVGVYSLTHKKIKPLANFPKNDFCGQLHTRPIWFTPKFH